MIPLRVLVVDDEKVSRLTTEHQLTEAGYRAEATDNGFEALDRIKKRPPDVVITDLRMPSMDGLELLKAIRDDYPRIDVIVMTAYGTIGNAVEAMRVGAIDYLTKPFPFEALKARLEQLGELRQARQELVALRKIVGAISTDLVGESAAMRQVRERIALFSAHAAPVLITGETGTGKELVARALHRLGPRASAPFIAIGCGTIPHDLAESELFGHERGAFTGATQRRPGHFVAASSGTLLLDDVDDLPLDVQVKLLRVLQEGRCRPVGGSDEVVIDVRLVTTTKKNLKDEVAAGCFREDLYYRLRGLELSLPPLRDRGDDVLLLAKHFIDLDARQRHQPAKRLSADAAGRLRRHRWPGNVRELRRAIEVGAILSAGAAEISAKDLPDDVGAGDRADALFSLHLDGVDHVCLPEMIRQIERTLIRWALRLSGGQQGRAAARLDIPRTTLQSKLNR